MEISPSRHLCMGSMCPLPPHLIGLCVVGVDAVAADLLCKIETLGHDGPRLGAADVQPLFVGEGRRICCAQDTLEICLGDAAGEVIVLHSPNNPLPCTPRSCWLQVLGVMSKLRAR
jgi:hypothetical protein